MTIPSRDFESELHDFCSEHYADPLGWVRGAFPWGEPGLLQAYKEPAPWQCEFFEWLGHEITQRQFDGVHAVLPIKGAISSGHGIGKGALTGMLVTFLMSTRRDAKGVVTANTNAQLQDKTWAGIDIWAKRAITAHWFTINASIMFRNGKRSSWKCTPQSNDPDNPQAFAGQHNVDSTSFYVFDEASELFETLIETADGGLSDGEPMMFLFGNPTRRRGTFYDVVFGSAGKRWKTWVIDARTTPFVSQAKIAADLEEFGGEDSDRFRVRVRGIPPKAEDAQFIDAQRVIMAQKRAVDVLPDEPLVAGCDLAWGGADSNVIRFRRGRDGRSIPAIRIPGEMTRDPSVLTNRLADVLSTEYGGHTVQMLFLDSAGIAGSVGTRLRELGHRNILEVNFGADSPNPKRRFMRDHMWAEMKDWLLTGAIDTSARLESDLTGPGLREDNQQRIWLESKKQMKARELFSPDEGDALALTFAQKVRPQVKQKPMSNQTHFPQGLGWMSVWAFVILGLW